MIFVKNSKCKWEKIEPTIFPDGTKLIKLPNVSFMGDIKWFFESEDELATLIYITNTLKDLGKDVFLYMPYIPNARFDRVKSNSEVFTLKWFCDILNYLKFEEVMVLDPHSHVSEALINKVEIQSPKNIIKSFIAKNFLDDCSLNKFALFFPDEGAMKRYSGMFKMPYTFGLKKRDWETGEIRGLDIVGDETFIKGRKVLIVDDICSRGGTFYHSAKKLKELGAEEVYLYVTHCENTILEGDLLTSGLIEKVFTTNSIFTKEHEMIQVFDLKGEE
jgi:ribose-phosphate pyrophosphokinase